MKTRVTSKGHKIAFDPVPHVYTVNSNEVPSITNSLQVKSNRWLELWKMKVAATAAIQNYTEAISLGATHEAAIGDAVAVGVKEPSRVSGIAASRGKKLHSIAELFVNEVLLSEVEEGEAFIDTSEKIERLAEKVGNEYSMVMENMHQVLLQADLTEDIFASELLLYSSRLEMCGTADVAGMGKNRGFVIDIKTGKNIYKSHALQLSFYKEALEEEFELPFDRYILHLRPNSKGVYGMSTLYSESDLAKYGSPASHSEIISACACLMRNWR